ncbi:MAG: hypothetical protein Q9M33_00535 [Robiginitomaculum sp.]|nr:hypothetical protein [Robiginitomaculum sp.]MDQ7078787.1 hypothetical protein [Robiginitomaculum sp.]
MALSHKKALPVHEFCPRLRQVVNRRIPAVFARLAPQLRLDFPQMASALPYGGL